LTLDALAANRESAETDLFVFLDGPRHHADIEKVQEVKRCIDSCEGFASVTCVQRETNLGLGRSIIDGVSSLLADFESVIVLEDDLVVSPFFLRYMLDGLNVYWDNRRVGSLHGYLYPLDIQLTDPFFIRGADCWGWATWRRAWQYFSPDGREMARQIRAARLERTFNFSGSINYLKALQQSGTAAADTWAVRWHASMFVRDMYSLYPPQSLVQNIGLDSSGSNCATTSAYHVELASSRIQEFPLEVAESEEARRALERFFRSQKTSWFRRQRESLMNLAARTNAVH